MKKRLLLFISAAIFLIFAVDTTVISHSAEKAEISVISSALTDKGVLVQSDGEEEITAIGSISKLYTATLIMKLCEEDLLSLDGRVSEYLPEFSMKDDRYKDITLRMLLNHTSGLPGSTTKNTMLYNDSDKWNHDNFLGLLKEQNLKYNPGTMANYCNDGYTLLELIIEKITGKSYAEYLHEVFDSAVPEEKLKTSGELIDYNGEFLNAAGSYGLYSDAENVCNAIYNIFCTENIISGFSAEQITSVREGAMPGEYFGLGPDNVCAYPFDAYGIKAITKSGDTSENHSATVLLSEYGICATVILKGGNSRIAEAKAIDMIIERLSAHYGVYVDFYEFEKPKVDEIGDLEELKKYEGLYLSGQGQYVVKLEKDKLIIGNVETDNITRLKYLGNDKFETGDGILYFSEINESIYIITEGIKSIGEKERYKIFDYYAVKVKSGREANDAWNERNGKLYFLCDEKYSSVLNTTGISYVYVSLNDYFPGYLGYREIIDESSAVSSIAIPGASGANLSDLYAFSADGKEYMSAHGKTYTDASGIPFIYCGEKSVCTILSDGYTRWFRAGEAQGKKIDVTFADSGSFSIYNYSGECVYSSLTDIGGAVIPKNGFIAFSGDIGTVFEITLANLK